jgi:hypothetical protein
VFEDVDFEPPGERVCPIGPERNPDCLGVYMQAYLGQATCGAYRCGKIYNARKAEMAEA